MTNNLEELERHPMPATALPWAICEEAPNDSWYEGRTLLGVPGGVRIGDLTPARHPDDRAADAAYIVHACNNYPATAREVEGLRSEVVALQKALHLYVRLLGPVRMSLAYLELGENPASDDSILFSFSGGGGSDWTTVGDFRKADKAARAALEGKGG